VGNAAGNEITSWWNPVSFTAGVIAVSLGAFLSAVYLVAESRRRTLSTMERYFRVRALGAGVVALAAGIACATALYFDNRQMFDRVIQRGTVLLLVGVLALVLAFFLAVRGTVRGLRLVSAIGVAALIWAWAFSQAPYLLPFTLTISDGAGAGPTLRWLLAWSGIAFLLIVPALILLYTLDQRTTALGEDPLTARG
jgi:cytochrome bd ubiquinol oxidase subunit II